MPPLESWIAWSTTSDGSGTDQVGGRAGYGRSEPERPFRPEWIRDTGERERDAYSSLARAAPDDRTAGSRDARLGGQRFGQEPLALDGDHIPLLHPSLTLPGILRVRTGLDHLVPEEESQREGDLDLSLFDGPEVGQPRLELDELEGLVLFVALMMRLGLIELPKDREEGGPNRISASFHRSRLPK